MKVKSTLLTLALIVVVNGFLFGQLSSSATYTAGNIQADAGFQIPSQSSTCPGTLVVSIPLGATITSVDVVYDFEAISGTGAYKSYQLSELRCVSDGGVNEGVLASFPNDWTTGVLTYERLGLTIANGVVGGGDIMFELHAGTTQGGQTGCSEDKLKINNNTWTVTVNYSDPSYPETPSNPNPQDGAEAVSINIGSLSWDFGNNTETYDLYFGTNNPPTTMVVENEISGTNGSYTLGTLAGSSNYFWQLVLHNSAKNELQGPVWSFSTECLPSAIPIFVDFDDFEAPQYDQTDILPLCWSKLFETAQGYTWNGVYNNTNAFSAPNCYIMANEADPNTWSMLISPEMSDPLNTTQLSFIVKTNYSNHPLQIGTMSDPTDSETFTLFSTVDPIQNQYTEIEVPFSSYSGSDNNLVIRYEALDMPGKYDYTYIDNVLISEVPTCPKPKELAVLEVTPTTAQVFWTEQGSAAQWNIEYVLAGEDPTGTPNVIATENPYTLTGLEPATSYNFYVQADCGDGDLSYWSAPGTFLTACLPTEIPIFENFDASTTLPDCWSAVATAGGTWGIQTYSSYSAPNCFKLQTYASDDVSMLVSPPLSVAGGSMADIKLNFFAKRTAAANNLIIGTISNPLDYTTFTPLTTVDLLTSNVWNEYEVWFNNYAGDDIYIAIKAGNLIGSTLYIDNINIGILPYCLNPINLTVDEIHETDARLNFTESREATMWEIEIGPVGFTPGTGAETQTFTYELADDNYTYVMTGLESGTFYDVYMRADCGGGDFSLWSPVAQFMSQLELFSPLPFTETFDPDFTYTGNPPTNPLNWILNTTLYHSAPNSAYNHYVGVSNNALLVTKRFDLTDRANVFLSFWHIAKTDGDRDHCYVEVSTDGGITYEPIPVSAYYGAGNYRVPTMNTPEGPSFDEDSYTEWGTTNSTPTNTWWKNETFNLSGYSGNDNVVIRFRLTADAYTNRFGWLIDDITVGTYTGVETAVNPGSFDVEVETGGSITETMTISNNGDFPILFTASVQSYTDAISTPVAEDFEAGVPETWTILNEGTSSGSMWNWVDGTATSYNLNGTNYISVNRSYPDTCSESLISPSFDATGYANVILNFDNVWAKGSSSAPDYSEVFVWDGSTWQSVLYMKTVNYGAWGNPDQTSYDITQYANPDMKIKFFYYGYSYSRWGIDNVTISVSDIPLNWLTLDGKTSVSGLVQGGSSQDIELGFSTMVSFPFDTWHTDIEIISSDPNHSPIMVPVDMTVGCFQPWEYLQTGKVHNISIPLEAAPSIFGEPLEAMDWIGVFYMDDTGEYACAGAVQWTGEAGVVINAYGDDATTEEKDGFATGEAFNWQLRKCGGMDDYPAKALYDATMPNQGNFTDFGLSKLVSLNAAYFQNYEFAQGWNSMSSYIVPADPAVENMFAPMVNDLTILRNLSDLYWPAEGLNTIGNWDNNSGYVIKVTEGMDFEIYGETYATGEVTIPAGWSYFPVLSQCAVDVMEMFSGNLDDVVIIQELIGVKVFWPAQGIYTLSTFEPGKAFILKLENEITISFPECVAKENSQTSTQINSIETEWGTLNMNPSSQIALFMADATSNLMDGDVIGAFDGNGNIYGYAQVSGKGKNLSMTFFGDDNTSAQKDGFTDNEAISFKLLRTSTGDKFDLEVVYSTELENISGTFVAGSFSAISDLKMKATGIGAHSSANLGVFPNPTSDILNITGISEETQVRIFNVFGEEVFNTKLSASSAINIGSLSKGTYVIRISDSQSELVNKLVIK